MPCRQRSGVMAWSLAGSIHQNLAFGAAPLTGWTAWDSAFVTGLYSVQKDFVTSKQMENEIVRQVTAANAEQERQKADEQRKS